MGSIMPGGGPLVVAVRRGDPPPPPPLVLIIFMQFIFNAFLDCDYELKIECIIQAIILDLVVI